MKYIALVPAYNPDQKMLSVIKELRENNFDVLVIDDGSAKDCEDLFLKAEESADVIHEIPNQGKGAAIKYGLTWIQEHTDEPSVIVTVDADGQHSAEDARRIADTATAHPDSLILGSRCFSGDDVPKRSRMGNTIMEKLFRLFTGTEVHDTQTGLRAFHSSLIPVMLKPKSTRYEDEMEVLLDCVSENIPIREVTIQTIYEEGNPSSHFHVIRDSFLICRQLFRFAFSSFSSFLIDYTFFALFTLFFGQQYVLAANVTARLISATANYELNRRFVFKEEGRHAESAVKYALLAAGILCLNTLVLDLFIHLGINSFLAKIMTELMLFFISWFMQKVFVFKKENRAQPSERSEIG